MIIFKKVLVWFYVVCISIKTMRQLHLGEIVVHDGQRFVLINGITRPLWHCQNINTEECCFLRESEFKRASIIKSLFHNLGFNYWFFMTNWYKIWCEQGGLDWTDRCGLWPDQNKNLSTK